MLHLQYLQSDTALDILQRASGRPADLSTNPTVPEPHSGKLQEFPDAEKKGYFLKMIHVCHTNIVNLHVSLNQIPQ